jgi:hypothetical protein
MWQVFAFMAQDRIRDRMAEAQRARLARIDEEWVPAPRRAPAGGEARTVAPRARHAVRT